MFDPESDTYVIEGDIVADRPQQLLDYHALAYVAQDDLVPDYPVGGIWNHEGRSNLSYCVASAAFGGQYATIVSAMHNAAAAWENVANVRFVHLDVFDDDCTTENDDVVFDVGVSSPLSEAASARAFLPTTSRTNRRLLLNDGGTGYGTWSARELVRILVHELGHVLGLRHEFPRSVEVGEDGRCTEVELLRASVMQYDWCGDGATTQSLMYPSHYDVQFVQGQYGAPTTLVNMRNGRVFVRQRLTGDIFEQDGGRWPRIGGPVQALVTVGDTLYAQGVGNGPLYRYLGTGSEWIPVNSTRTGQIFRCGEGLCATDWQTGTLYEVATGNDLGVTVTDLATSAGSLFGLVSTREQILRRNDGVWLDAGNGASALASTTTDLYRVTSEGMVVEVWSSDATWSPLNHLSVRQLLGTGDELYGLLSNALGIVRWESPEWVPTGGPASRVYGSYGSLYASSPRWDEYYRYDLETNVWLYQGAP